MFLATGRRGQYFWPDTDPYALYYGPDRTWRTFYVAPARSEAQYVADEIRRRLVPAYREAGFAWYVEHRNINASAGVLATVIRAQPDVFARVFSPPRGTYQVYRLNLPPL